MKSKAKLGKALCHAYDLEHSAGIANTALDGVRLLKIDKYHKVTPNMYQQSIVFILQGSKIGHVNKHQLVYDQEHCLIVATPYPIACETFASQDEPLIGLYIDLDKKVLTQLVEEITELGKPDWSAPNDSIGVSSCRLSPKMDGCINRLAETLLCPKAAKILGPQILREFYYHQLTGPEGYLLYNSCLQESAISQVSSVIHYIQTHYEEHLSINDLAAMAGMSISVFHRVFKQVVTDPPLQYIKKVRLNKAKSHIVQEGMTASAAAFKVGYESPTQFSREFKRYFGTPPSRIAEETAGAMY